MQLFDFRLKGEFFDNNFYEIYQYYYVCTGTYFLIRVTWKGAYYLIVICDLNTLLIETYLSFIFQWHLLQPERRVVCVGELKIASSDHTAILCHCLRFSLKRKRNLCSELWKFQLQRVWPLPLSRQDGSPRAEHSILFEYQRYFAF